jgi:1-acyl-sn-glycerol-3-phosphate acyltransferase
MVILRFLYRAYQLCIAAPVLIIATLLTALVTIVFCSLFPHSKVWSYYPAKLWGTLFCRMLLLPLKVEGRGKLDKKASYVFVANHQGAMDIFLVYALLGHNFKWMMKKSLRKVPLVGEACYKADFIFVDRSSPKGVKDTITNARDILKDGTSLMIFPEGSRTFNGKMIPFKNGAFFLADALQLPVVPITIDGSFDVLPRTRGVNFVNFHRMKLTIHDVILPQGQGPENIRAISQQSFDAINSALPNQYKTI